MYKKHHINHKQILFYTKQCDIVAKTIRIHTQKVRNNVKITRKLHKNHNRGRKCYFLFEINAILKLSYAKTENKHAICHGL